MKLRKIIACGLAMVAGEALFADVSSAFIEGLDYKSGTIKVTGATTTPTIAVTDQTAGTQLTTVGNAVSVVAGTYTFALSGLVPSHTYAWTVGGVAQAPSYTAGVSNSWFSATTSQTQGGAWAKNTEPAVADGKYVLDGETPAVFNPTTSAPGPYATVEADVSFTCGTVLDDDDLSLPDGAGFLFTLAATEGENSYYWVVIFSDATTKVLTGEAAAETGTWTVRMECDAAQNDKHVRFSVKKQGGDAFVQLKPDGAETAWIQVTAPVGKLGFDGEGLLAGFSATAVDVNVAAVDGVEYATLAEAIKKAKESDPDKSVTLLTSSALSDLSALDEGFVIDGGESHRLSWADVDGKYITAGQDGKFTVKTCAAGSAPANGLPSSVSYALNLDPEIQTSVPLVVSEPNGEADKITLALNVAQREGVNVTYALEESTSAYFTEATTKTGATQLNNPRFVVGLSNSTTDPKLKYYRLKATVNQ